MVKHMFFLFNLITFLWQIKYTETLYSNTVVQFIISGFMFIYFLAELDKKTDTTVMSVVNEVTASSLLAQLKDWEQKKTATGSAQNPSTAPSKALK